MNNQLIYKEGNIDNLHELTELAIHSYIEYTHILSPEHGALFSKNIHSEARMSDLISLSKVFMCVHNERVVGMAFLVSSGHPTPMFDTDWSYIKMVGVEPEYRGKGIAKNLMKLCVNQAQQMQERFIALHTSEFMHAARHIYECCGFTKLKEIDAIFDKKYWIYLKALTQIESKLA